MVRPFLTFEGSAEAAMSFYVSLFPDGEVLSVTKHTTGDTNIDRMVMLAEFTVAGQRLLCSDSPIHHQHTFTPSLSLHVESNDADEIARLFSALAVDGRVLMPIGDYGFSQRFGWVNDRFGVSWQLALSSNLPA
jgi:predicted 3-demethylubiquinone-9 3-methyltransferase (glyoxalase superfamily)